MSASDLVSIGSWQVTDEQPAFSPDALKRAAERFREPVHVVRQGDGGSVGVAFGGRVGGAGLPLLATLPALYPEWLGDRSFLQVHGVRFPYVAGAMANGIATTDMVIAMGRAGMLGFFGAAGLGPKRVEAAIDTLKEALPDAPWGSNLIHSPNEPALERGIADLYIRRGVKRVSASAYMALTPAIVRYAFHGVRELPDGTIHRENFVFAKISRPETAARFMSPPSVDILRRLVDEQALTPEEARLAARLPVAEDITVEADSGGHTDNQALPALFPIILGLRDQMVAKHGFVRPIRVGAAGGLGTPGAVAAAFALGAAYVLTGSVNQGAIESGLDPSGRVLLARAGLADVIMAPAADMFELGVKVQVLKRGTMFGVRALRLYEIYTTYGGLDDIPPHVKEKLERETLQASCEQIWEGTRAFFSERDPREVARAERDPKHKMALVFRWYLGLSSKWAIAGDPQRRMDYQIWCGPAMGSFNAWVAGSFLEPPEARTVVQIARNMLEGAAVITRAQQLRSFGVPLPASAFNYSPRPLA